MLTRHDILQNRGEIGGGTGTGGEKGRVARPKIEWGGTTVGWVGEVSIRKGCTGVIYRVR